MQALQDCQFSKALFEQFTEEMEGIRWFKNSEVLQQTQEGYCWFLPY